MSTVSNKKETINTEGLISLVNSCIADALQCETSTELYNSLVRLEKAAHSAHTAFIVSTYAEDEG